MESFCHVGGRHGGHENYGHPCYVLPGAQNCAACGKDWAKDTTGPVARPIENPPQNEAGGVSDAR